MYVTTEKDAIRRINRMPSTYFLLNNQEITQASDNDKIETEIVNDFDDLFDEFVMIDKEELN